MKNITNYFPSPTKASKSFEVENNTKTKNDQNVNIENQNSKTPNESTNYQKNVKKKKRRKNPTDPEVKNVAELLPNNLTLTSPNNSKTNILAPTLTRKRLEENMQKTPNKFPKDNLKAATKDQDIEILNVSTNARKDASPSNLNLKVNAFQFLMNSKNNIIGQNSDGIDVNYQTISNNEEKEKLNARKNLFKSWADQKGAAKRKREEEEIEKCINVKLIKRAKRLKKMLHIDKKRELPLKLNKKIRKLSSTESENSNDLKTETETLNSHLINNITEICGDSQIKISKSPLKKYKENNLLNFLGVTDKFNKENAIEVVENSYHISPKQTNNIKEKIEIERFTPKSKKNTSLKNKIIIDESSEEEKIKKHKKKKRKLKLDDSSADFCSPVKVKPTKKSTIRKLKTKKNTAEISEEADKVLESQVTYIDESTKDSGVKNSKRKLNKKFVIGVNSIKGEEIELLKRKSRQNVEQTLNTEGEDTPTRRTLRKRNSINYKNTTPFIELPKSSLKEKANKSKIINKKGPVEKIEVSSVTSDYEETAKKRHKHAVKVAPIFIKVFPKPKLDPETVEARKQFLLSGIPNSLKKAFEKHQSIKEKELDVFPTISHIQQKCDSQMWNLSRAKLNYKKISDPAIQLENLKCKDLITKSLPYDINIAPKVENIKNLKDFLQQIKSENPDYPVFKVFRHIQEKSGKNTLKEEETNTKSSKRQSRKLKGKSIEIKTDSINTENYEMWTEKYKPRCSEEILGNHHAVGKLKKWLEIWMNYSQEINAIYRNGLDSESEFESTDCDSKDSIRLPGNTMVLYGPSGSGKTSVVYAIANELGFNVIELNASTKRTGKRLLQELQEATQSHQVGKTETNSLTNFINPSKKSSQEDKKYSQKMCILFLEDIDLIFEQDEGFLSSLTQLITTSKRPIILTTTDNTPVHVQKFISQYECISFMPFSMRCLGIWLQLVCLVEGILVDKSDLGNLLEYNKGDLRKTILEIQFWSLTDETNKSTLKIQEAELGFDNKPNDMIEDNEVIYKNCLGSFKIFSENKEHCIPRSIDLGLLWWNVPNILNVPSSAFRRQNKEYKQNIIQYNKGTTESLSDLDRNKLNSASVFYDSLILTDLLFKNYPSSNEPLIKNYSAILLDSLELSERKEDGREIFLDVFKDLTHNLMAGCIENYEKISGATSNLNMTLPDSKERRWRDKQHVCEDSLKGSIQLTNILDRKSVALDYLSTLRQIARSEEQRASANTKRGNRFRHYLKDFMNFKQSSCSLACNVLKTD